jgi:hypothetical protein
MANRQADGWEALNANIRTSVGVKDIDNTTEGAGVVPAAVAAYVTAVEKGSGVFRQTVLTLAALPQAISDASSWQSTKIYDFPAGRIWVLTNQISLAPTTTSTIATTIKSGVAGAVALGTVATDSISLTGTEVDLCPSKATTNSTTINVAAAAVTEKLAAAAFFDGTTTAIDCYLNSSVAAADIDGDGTLTWTGTITLNWVNCGDY